MWIRCSSVDCDRIHRIISHDAESSVLGVSWQVMTFLIVFFSKINYCLVAEKTMEMNFEMRPFLVLIK